MNYHYSKGWFRAKKKALSLYTEEQAEKLHKAKKLYCVIVGNIEKPFAIIDINNDFYGVSFFDEHLRATLDYHFVIQENDKLFLEMATYREFIGSNDKPQCGTSYIFSTSGKVRIRKQDFNINELLESESQTNVDSNWESIPEFGSYESLLKIER